MIFLEHSGLSRIVSKFQSLDVLEGSFDVKIEFVSYSKSDTLFKEDNHENSKPSFQDITSYFKKILNKCFEDYDFSNLSDSYFKEVKNLDSVVNNIYYNVSNLVGTMFPDFSDEFWNTIKQVVNIKSCEIYTFDSGGEDDPFNDENSISSFNYFLLNKKQRQILFISCITKSTSDSQDKVEFNNTLQDPSYCEGLATKTDEDCLSEVDVPEIL